MNTFTRVSVALVAALSLTGGTVAAVDAKPTPTAHAAVWTVCGAYDTWQEAYDAWVKEGKPRRADADGDGIPCESLPGAPSVAPGDTTPTPAPSTPADPDSPAPSTPTTPDAGSDDPATDEGSDGEEGSEDTDDESSQNETPAKTKKCKLPKSVVSISFSKTKYPNIKAHTERAIKKGQPRILKLNRVGADARRKKLLKGIPTKKGYDRDEYAPAVGRSTWKADVEYVPSSENRSHGSTMGKKLNPYCDGTKFKYTWY